MTRWKIALVPVVLATLAGAVAAQPPEFPVNTNTLNAQGEPAIAMRSGGDFVVTWSSAHLPGFVAVQCYFDAPAIPTGIDTLVSTTPHAHVPAIAVSDSFHVVAWEHRNGLTDTVKVQVFDLLGAPVDTTIIIPDASAPAVAMAPSGDFVVVFEHPYPLSMSLPDIYSRSFSVTGGPPGPLIPVNTFLSGYQLRPSVAMDTAGNYVVAWESEGLDGDQYGVAARRFDASGNALGDEFQVNAYAALRQGRPDVAMTDSGGFAVVWESAGQDGSSDGVYCRYFDANGDTLTGEFRVNQFTVDMQNDPACAFDGHGNLIVTWTSEAQDGDVSGVFARRFGPIGNALGDEFQVNVQTILYQIASDVAAADDGSFVVVWQDFFGDASGFGIKGRHYDAGSLSAAATPVAGATLLSQNVPNPFNPVTTIRFTMSAAGPAHLSVYDVTGRLVTTLIDGARTQGLNTVVWDGRDSDGMAVRSGVYFYRLRAGSETLTRKMVLIK